MAPERSAAALRWHYDVERDLADRLRNAPAGSRALLYPEVYEELFERVPDHPQTMQANDDARSDERVGHKLALVRRFVDPATTLLEIGAGDGAFAAAIAPFVHRVIALDVTDAITDRSRLPDNVDLVLSDGTTIPVEPGSIDLAYSNQLIEHLHPDDAAAQLTNIVAALRPGGRYLCLTPNRLSGPHDVSRAFDPVATGLHLREYSLSELSELFEQAGLEVERVYPGGRGHYARLPIGITRLGEFVFEHLHESLRCRLRETAPAKALLGLNVLARKP